MSELLDRYADGELPVATRARVEAHLVACPACRAHLTRLEGLRGLIQRELRDPARAADLSGLWPAIEARLDAGGAALAEAAGKVEAADGVAGRAGLRAVLRPGARRRPRAAAGRRPLDPPAARARAALVGKWPPAAWLAAAAAVLMLALALPLARLRIDPMDRAATVASVESGETSSVVLLAGSPQQPPIIWVTELSSPPIEEPSL